MRIVQESSGVKLAYDKRGQLIAPETFWGREVYRPQKTSSMIFSSETDANLAYPGEKIDRFIVDRYTGRLVYLGPIARHESATTDVLVKKGLIRRGVQVYSSIERAISAAEHATKPLWPVLGDEGEVWLVHPADWDRLIKTGYEAAR